MSRPRGGSVPVGAADAAGIYDGGGFGSLRNRVPDDPDGTADATKAGHVRQGTSQGETVPRGCLSTVPACAARSRRSGRFQAVSLAPDSHSMQPPFALMLNRLRSRLAPLDDDWLAELMTPIGKPSSLRTSQEVRALLSLPSDTASVTTRSA